MMKKELVSEFSINKAQMSEMKNENSFKEPTSKEEMTVT